MGMRAWISRISFGGLLLSIITGRTSEPVPLPDLPATCYAPHQVAPGRSFMPTAQAKCTMCSLQVGPRIAPAQGI